MEPATPRTSIALPSWGLPPDEAPHRMDSMAELLTLLVELLQFTGTVARALPGAVLPAAGRATEMASYSRIGADRGQGRPRAFHILGIMAAAQADRADHLAFY